MDELVSAVKELQRSDPDAKQQWWSYCDALGQGVHDPAKHNESFIQTFIGNYQSGRRFEINVPAVVSSAVDGSNVLAQLCKDGQRKSHPWKQTWAQYCQHYGGGRNDPEKHDATFIQGFLDYVAGRGILALSAAASATDFGSAAKRQRTAYAPQMTGGACGGGGDGQAKGSLVQRIKTYQRSSEEAKEAWGSYCDAHLGGVRDPARHDGATLRQFAENHGVP
mmetsp:Transcript_30094/g.40490  ORF Transcript_30094/g.40490 Transcript_30094/m.40490 type:complete len:222 (+) Transcript_30094:54-719(+)